MTLERIKEIQDQTAYPNSVSVQQALFQVWNECAQEKTPKTDVFLMESSMVATFMSVPSAMLGTFMSLTSSDKDNDNQCNYCQWIWA